MSILASHCKVGMRRPVLGANSPCPDYLVSSRSLSKRLARFTKPLRLGLGLATPGMTTSGSLPFRRSVASGGATGRIASLENDVNRLVGGWNQHLPQILATVSEARQAVYDAAARDHQVHVLTLEVERLQAEIAKLNARLDGPNERMSGSPDPRAPRKRPTKSGFSRT